MSFGRLFWFQHSNFLTILSPTIAGEGAREAFQALLLEKRLGGVPQAVFSGALGFVAAEAATMWGGALVDKKGYMETKFYAGRWDTSRLFLVRGHN